MDNVHHRRMHWELVASKRAAMVARLSGADLDRRDGRVDALLSAMRNRSTIECPKILDLGCGVGQYRSPIEERGAHYTGVDRSRSMLRNVPDSRGVVAGDLGSLPFASSSFDGVLCIYVLDFVDDPLAALRELRRVTKPQATVLIELLGPSTHQVRSRWRRFLGEQPIATGLTSFDLEELVQHDGSFEILQSQCDGEPTSEEFGHTCKHRCVTLLGCNSNG